MSVLVKKNIRICVSASFLMLVAGCDVTSAPDTKIISEPTDALVTIDGYGTCQTPCTIAHDSMRMITVAKAGFTPQRFRVSPGAGEVKVVLELAAPTSGVEESGLPEL